MEKKCKICSTTEDVNFDGMCKKCYDESIIISKETIKNETKNKNEFIKNMKEKIKNIISKENAKTIIIIILSILLLSSILLGNTKRNMELNNQVENLTSQIENFKKHINDLNAKLDKSKKDLTENENQINNLQTQKETLEKDKQKLQEENNNLETKNNELNQEVEQLKISKASKSTSTNYSLSSQKSVSTAYSNSYTVYITNTGNKYHRDGCSYLRKSQKSIDKNSAIAQGYTPCSRCNP